MGHYHDDTAWGPFISKNYVRLPVSRGDIIAAAVVFALANFFALTAAYLGYGQTKACRRPLRCAYIWMIWLELAASVVISIQCLLFLLRLIRPSFYFYMSILLNWSIQVQLLLQIIINRIRVILSDQRKGRHMIIGVAVIVTMINISVFCIWMPARLQISHTYVRINEIWDRIEKVLYLLIDGALNWYFIRVVKANLVKNGLEKYNRLVRFNQRIIIISLLMDVMIIGAMSIPNGFVYAIFHPLAYLVKLNIEISMADLIKKIALAGHAYNRSSMSHEFKRPSLPTINDDVPKRRSFLGRHFQIPRGNEIRKTEEYLVQSTPKSKAELQQQEQQQQRSCETYWKEWGMEKIDCKDRKSQESVDHVGVLPSTISASKEETRTWSIGTEDEILAKPEPAVKHW